MKVHLSPKPEIINLTQSTFLYIEKIGPFMQTAPQAWQEFWEAFGPIMNQLSIKDKAGLSRIDEEKVGDQRFIYQAGVFFNKKPESIPASLKLRETPSGKYACFHLKGSYSQLAHAYPLAFEILGRENFQLRNEFCAEIYLNDPQVTAEENLETNILFPIF